MFTTYRPSTGAAYTLAGTPVVRVYKNGSTTQHTTTYSVTADFDTITGLNYFTIDTSADGTFYAAGGQFTCVLEAGTVDSVSVVGTVVGTFSLNAVSALRPTTAGRTLDVSAGGEAGIDWANVGSPTTVVGLTGTTIKTATDVETDTQDIQTKIGTPAVSLAADLVVIDDFLDTEVAAILADTNELQTDWVNGGRLDLLIDAIKAKTDSLTFTTANQVDATTVTISTGAVSAAALATDAVEEIADGILDRNMATGTDSGTTTIRTVRQALRVLRNKVTVVAGTPTTATVYKENDVTQSWTAEVTTTAGDPISAIDPAGP